MSFKLKKIASRQECIASTISQQGTVVYDVSFFERESLNCMILKILPKPPKCQEVKIQTGTVLTSNISQKWQKRCSSITKPLCKGTIAQRQYQNVCDACCRY